MKPKGSELSAKTDEHKLYFHERKKEDIIFGADQNADTLVLCNRR
jgi:hypothetical protein